MVAISLYRGNMHRVPDVPRRWMMPPQKLTLKEFKSLLNRRNKALARLQKASATADVATTSNHDPKPSIKALEENNSIIIADTPQIKIKEAEKAHNFEVDKGGFKELKVERADVSGSQKAADLENVNFHVKKLDIKDNVNCTEEAGKDDVASSEREKRKKEIEEKLQVLNERKHNLVQVLKQILNVEEELKRRNAQAMANGSSVPLQVDVTNDSGSMGRQLTPRMGSEGNVGGHMMEGGENEDVSNPNTNSNHHSHLMKRMSSTSPSSESPLRKPHFGVVPHPARQNLATTSSPSRFAPVAPTVAISGTSYIASSPSPAASGGTSAFRDARQPSPWN